MPIEMELKRKIIRNILMKLALGFTNLDRTFMNQAGNHMRNLMLSWFTGYAKQNPEKKIKSASQAK